MRVLRVNEPMCPCCGRGAKSGYHYPDCAHPPEGMTSTEAHRVFCSNFDTDVCAACLRLIEVAKP